MWLCWVEWRAGGGGAMIAPTARKGARHEPLSRDHRGGDEPGATAGARPDHRRPARPVRRPVSAADPRARDLRARIEARRASALGYLLAGPPVGARDHYHRPLLAGAVRMVCPRS